MTLCTHCQATSLAIKHLIKIKNLGLSALAIFPSSFFLNAKLALLKIKKWLRLLPPKPPHDINKKIILNYETL